jgi:hypothetical protein
VYKKTCKLKPTSWIIRMWSTLEYTNILIWVKMARNLLDLMTMKIIFYIESAIVRFQKDIHYNVLVNFSHFLFTFL